MNRSISLAAILAGFGCSPAELSYIGTAECGSCHEQQLALWRGSHHDLAMDSATTETVLGDFSGIPVRLAGVEYRFYRDGERFLVDTEGADGSREAFQVGYTFGVYPLQQYLVPFPGGRLQALPLAWDSRPAGNGGQRWFHLYADDPPRAGEALHWTGRYQSWNLMCADCHSTDLRRGYDLTSDSYRTTWAEMDVACEACHGPGSRHAELARKAGYRSSETGFPTSFSDSATWLPDPAGGIARRSAPPGNRNELDSCAPCHSRRSTIAHYTPGDRFLDKFIPSLLEEDLYFADGQIRDEVYVYGSFVQSRMYRAGVTCSDCHDPHSLRLRAEGNALCGRCHTPAKYDVAEHTLHRADSEGSHCVSCHMPERIYMVVDDRRDHSFRIPRPELTPANGSPNACNQCHQDESPAWAAQVIDESYPPAEVEAPFARAIADGRRIAYRADQRLATLAANESRAGIVRGTALRLLAGFPTEAAYRSVMRVQSDPEPLVRMGAARALAGIPPRERALAGTPLLTDSITAVRLDAARSLAGIPGAVFSQTDGAALEATLAEYRQAQLFNSDWPQSHVNLGLLAERLGDSAAARAAYRTAIRLDSTFVPGWANLAELERSAGNDGGAAETLRRGLAVAEDSAALEHALGLTLVRLGDRGGAERHLAAAARHEPANTRYSYVRAIALHSSGREAEAQMLLERIHQRDPEDREVLFALVTILRDRGSLDIALEYARKLAALEFGSPRSTALLEQLDPANR